MSSHDFSKEFFAAYHASVFESLGDEAVKYNARIGSLLANRWLKTLASLPEGKEDFKKAMEAWMRGPFRFADITELSFSDGAATLYVKGCDICQGNEILRRSGGKVYCPISQLVKSAMGKGLKAHVELTGSEKPGPVGECYLKYKVE